MFNRIWRGNFNFLFLLKSFGLPIFNACWNFNSLVWFRLKKVIRHIHNHGYIGRIYGIFGGCYGLSFPLRDCFFAREIFFSILGFDSWCFFRGFQGLEISLVNVNATQYMSLTAGSGFSSVGISSSTTASCVGASVSIGVGSSAGNSLSI